MIKKSDNMTEEKANGRYYTPSFIVKNILDLSNYHDKNILKKNIIDNSCGDGAFLTEIVDRYCSIAQKSGYSNIEIKKDLATYIHGIELNLTECTKCIENVNLIIKKYNISNVKWDITCNNSLSVHTYDNKMDYVIGNPPYVRIHNLGNSIEDVKKYVFAQSGMTDLYLVFFEIGLRMLNNNGVLGYITPSSFFNSLAGSVMRKYLIQNKLISKIVDLKHYQAFNATTYTAITILKKSNPSKNIDYFEFDEKNMFPFYVDTLTSSDFFISGNFYFANKNDLSKFKKILNFRNQKEYFSVKNGFATLADSFFIGNFDFSEYIIPILKASTGKTYQCIFPYDKNGIPIKYDTLTKNPDIKNYFSTNQERLTKRSLDRNSNWYTFGRSQGVKDVYKQKYAINSLIRTISDIKLISCKPGIGVYSGLYILTELPEYILKELLFSESFLIYIKLLGKYKSGGYYTFSSKDLKQYLEYEYSQRIKEQDEQFSIFGNP